MVFGTCCKNTVPLRLSALILLPSRISFPALNSSLYLESDFGPAPAKRFVAATVDI